MSIIPQKYESSIQTRKRFFFFLTAVCLLTPISSFSAMIDMRLEQIDKTVFAHVFLTILPEEEVSGIQLDYGYDTQNWEFVSAFPGETLVISNKQLQIAPVYSLLRVLIIGFNNYPIPNGELFVLQFNALSEGVNPSGFNVLQVKLSSPQAKPVSSTINNINNSEGTEPSADNNADNNLEKETSPSDINNPSPSTETGVNDPTVVKSPPDIKTNTMDTKPVIQEVANTKTTPTYSQTSSSKLSTPNSSSGFVTNIGNPYIHEGNAHSQAKKAENKVNAPKFMPIPEKNVVFGKQYIPGNEPILIGNNIDVQNGSLKPYFTDKSRNTSVSGLSKSVNKSTLPVMNTTTENNLNINAAPLNNANKPLQNPYFALNISNISPNKGRSNKCTIIETNISKDHISTTSNSLIIFVSITVSLLIILTATSTVIKKQDLFFRKK